MLWCRTHRKILALRTAWGLRTPDLTFARVWNIRKSVRLRIGKILAAYIYDLLGRPTKGGLQGLFRLTNALFENLQISHSCFCQSYFVSDQVQFRFYAVRNHLRTRKQARTYTVRPSVDIVLNYAYPSHQPPRATRLRMRPTIVPNLENTSWD